MRAALALGSIALVGTTGTLAYWSDTVEVAGTTLTAGSLDLKVNSLDSVDDYTDLSLSGMVPGSSTAGVLTVQNSGSVPLTYTATSSSDNAALTGASVMAVKVTGDTTVSGTGLAQTCAGAALPNSGASLGGTLLGSAPAPRMLQPGASETLCVQATLSTTAPDTAQGQSATVTLTFTANQVT